MLTLPLSYENLNGVLTNKNYYFNLTKAEIALRELETDGTWTQTLQKIKDSNKGSEVFPEFQKIIRWTYGVKSEDGESFDKSDAVWALFVNSPAWDVLMMRLLTEPGFSEAFITKVIPRDLVPQVAEQNTTPGFRPGADTSRPTPPVAGQPVVVQEQPFSAPAQPAAPVYQEPPQQVAPPVFTQPEQVPGPQSAEGVIRQSTPRIDPFQQ